MTLRSLLSALAALLLLALAARAQQPLPPEEPALRVDVRLVNVEVAVTDPEGNLVRDLTAARFLLREDGVPQRLAHFAPTRAPVRIALLVEASPAVFLIRYDHILSATHLLAGLRPEDEAALLTYADRAQVEVPFTRDKPWLQQRLHNLGRFSLGRMDIRLSDAVAQTCDWLSPPRQRTAVLVIGTGLDLGSQTPWDELERRLGAGQLTFFAVATGRLLRGEPDSGEKNKKKRGEQATAADANLEATFAEADARLRAMAEASAGQAFFPESADELDEIYRAIAERLRNLYSLGYYSSNPARDGAYRRIEVELVDETGAPLPYRVFARPGYFAPKE